ncbi:hypothetical protein LOTGIDRAFT_156301 [Lottia gigantea]|uniref:PABC domain-containing protein n=1 Tax=Lottia gigantea TaxID=225164 RepID=V4B3S3_LOTGI|nr:hypothetical protein LOTGIDRAFT_156301 [Lottia gigantea]ESP05043.1 hypothetical protein LOTGIDRAFT_156301 [Lottia gigantea]
MGEVYPTEEILGDHIYSQVSELTDTNVEKITGMLLECERPKILEMLQNRQVLMSYVKVAEKTISKNSTKESKQPEVSILNKDQECDKDVLGEKLYDKILELVDSELLAAKITGKVAITSCLIRVLVLSFKHNSHVTELRVAVLHYSQPFTTGDRYGMLLELDSDKLSKLLKSTTDLKQAIEKSRTVLETERTEELSPTEIMAEIIYSRVEIKYPDLAPQITGMLIELEDNVLEKLVNSEQLLDSRIEEAFSALQQNSS